ncbi:MAG: MmcQ/YjbR family DNA-binding protein [Cytophagales bacterium]|nr:MmcQ/YjbR family DNA-binding protein [Cytophagales bacterium]
MTAEYIRDYCLAKPGVTESEPFGYNTLVYKVGTKMFLILPLDATQLQFNVKCDPEHAIALRELYDWVHPGYHQNKKHWNTVLCKAGNDKLLKDFIDLSYHLVVAGMTAKEKSELALLQK